MKEGRGNPFWPNPACGPRPTRAHRTGTLCSLSPSLTCGSHTIALLHRLPRSGNLAGRARRISLPPLYFLPIWSRAAPLNSPHALLLFPLFPLPISLPGQRNPSPEIRSPTVFSSRFRRSQVIPHSLSYPILLLLPWRMRWCPWFLLICSSSINHQRLKHAGTWSSSSGFSSTF
jgi:hypothetical protein